MKKFLSATALMLGVSSVAAGIQPVSAAETGPLFSDVGERYGFYNEIEYLINEEIVSGFPDGSFRPDQGVTRAQAAIMLGRALGFSGKQQKTAFSDVDPSSVASGYIAEAVKNGVISGYPDGTYRPGALVTRGDMAILLDRAYELTEMEGQMAFNDVNETMKSYQAIQNVAASGISVGYNSGGGRLSFKPYQTVKRGEFSAMVARADFPEVFSPTGIHATQWVSVLDVGTSDAILITYPDGSTTLIDTGSDPVLLENALQELPYFSGNIDMLILTHPDPDHIGNAGYVLDNYDVEYVIDNGQDVDTPEFNAYLEALDNSNAEYYMAEVGDDLSFWPATTLEVLHTDDDSENIDEGTMVLKLNRYKNDILFMSDAGPETEAELLASGKDLEADILILSDYFAYNAGSQEFIDAVNPADAFFSWNATPEDELPAIFETLDDRFTFTTINGSIRITETRGMTYALNF